MSGRPETAAQMVRRVLLAVLPPGVPPSFREVVSGEFHGSGRSRVARAELVMFDGFPAKAEAFLGGKALGFPIWGHRWTDLPGGSVSFEGGRWIRIDPETLEPFKEQGELALPPVSTQPPTPDAQQRSQA